MKTLIWVLLVFVSVFFLSCSKEMSYETPLDQPPATATLEGKWQFLHLITDIEASVSLVEQGVRFESRSSYKDTSTKNSGEINIDPATVKGKYGYTIDTYIHSTIKQDGSTVADFKEKFEFDIESTEFIAPYTKIGADSMYFPNGVLFAAPDPSDPTAQLVNPPGGTKYTIQSDTLVLYIHNDITQSDAGATTRMRGNVTAYYKKQ